MILEESICFRIRWSTFSYATTKYIVRNNSCCYAARRWLSVEVLNEVQLLVKLSESGFAELKDLQDCEVPFHFLFILKSFNPDSDVVSPAPPSSNTLSGTTTAAMMVDLSMEQMCGTKFSCL